MNYYAEKCFCCSDQDKKEHKPKIIMKRNPAPKNNITYKEILNVLLHEVKEV
jgi:hypothetical protein